MSNLQPTVTPVRGRTAHSREERVLVEIDCLVGNYQVFDAVIPAGVSTVEVPRSEVAKLEKLTVDEDTYRKCERIHERNVQKFKDSLVGLEPDSVPLNTKSIPGEYLAQTGEGMPPFRSFKILDEGRPAPLTQEEEHYRQVSTHVAREQAQLIADALKSDKPKRSRSRGNGND